jgi:hypothetical protein
MAQPAAARKSETAPLKTSFHAVLSAPITLALLLNAANDVFSRAF